MYYVIATNNAIWCFRPCQELRHLLQTKSATHADAIDRSGWNICVGLRVGLEA